ncbi:MAG: hypothetical protein LBK72_00670, partial [Bifidobacteriaceae bacterium]|jgi:hypothetical protein|nr:hypothetical protein [Bifidobacteriaceae bacterium]
LAADIAAKDRSVLVKVKAVANLEMTFLLESDANRAVHEVSLHTDLDPAGIQSFLGTRRRKRA